MQEQNNINQNNNITLLNQQNFNNNVNSQQTMYQPSQQPEIQEKKSGIKNFFIYELFNFIFGIIIPVIVMLLDYFILSKIDVKEGIANLLALIALCIQLFAYFSLKEVLNVKFAIKAARSKYLMSKFVFILNTISILLATYIFITKGTNNIKYYTIFYICFVLCKVISYILTKKLILKEKIQHKKILLTSVLSFTLLIILIVFSVNPTGFNKMLYTIFGKNEFSSKELKIKLIDNYNTTTYDDKLNYTHTFTEKELKEIENLDIDFNITKEDLSKLTNLKTLVLSNADLQTIDVPSNSNLIWLEICDSTVENININSGILKYLYIEKTYIDKLNISNKTIQEIEIKNATIKNLVIENTKQLEDINITNSSIENATLNNNPLLETTDYSIQIDKIENLELKNISNMESFLENAKLEFKKMTIEETYKMYLETNDYMKLRYNHIEFPTGTKVKKLVGENMTIIVKNYKGETISQDSILSGYVELYDNSNNLIFELGIY